MEPLHVITLLEQLTLLLREELAPYASDRCSPADGYVRSEGVGALVLSSCGVARAIAVLCGCAVRQDGRSASLTAPNGSAQRTLLTGALGRASLTASEVVGLELHGTGTGLGDPTEAGALASVARCSVGGDDGGRRQGECGPLKGGLRSARHAAGVAVVVRAARVWQRASAAIEPFGEGAARLIVRSAGAANAGGAKRVHRRARGELVRLLRARAAACERAAARDGAGGGRDARGARGRAVRQGGEAVQGER